MIRIFIADDHPLIRSGLKQIVAQEADLQVLAEAENSEQLLDLIDQKPCDVILLDISMPGRNGLDALSEIRRRKPDLPVLMLSIHPEEQYAVRAIKAGANGYINKASPSEELIRAIRRVRSGKKYISAGFAETLADAINSNEDIPAHKLLSDREYQVLCEMASGKTVSEIAVEVSLSVKTVSTYRARVLEKLNMRTNAELTRYALKNGLVD